MTRVEPRGKCRNDVCRVPFSVSEKTLNDVDTTREIYVHGRRCVYAYTSTCDSRTGRGDVSGSGAFVTGTTTSRR